MKAAGHGKETLSDAARKMAGNKNIYVDVKYLQAQASITATVSKREVAYHQVI